MLVTYDTITGQAIPNGTDEAVFVNIFGTRSYPHLNAVNQLYLTRYAYPLESVVDTEFLPATSIHDSLLSIRISHIIIDKYMNN